MKSNNNIKNTGSTHGIMVQRSTLPSDKITDADVVNLKRLSNNTNINIISSTTENSITVNAITANTITSCIIDTNHYYSGGTPLNFNFIPNMWTASTGTYNHQQVTRSLTGDGTSIVYVDSDGQLIRGPVPKKQGPKKRKGKLLSVTIEPEVIDKFDAYCEEHAYSKSKLIENLLMKYIDEQEKFK